MKISYKTDTGKKREHNEDSIIVDEKKDIYILADGMGGRRAGEMASKMAVEVVYDSLQSSIKNDTEGKDIPAFLESAIMSAHEAIKVSSKYDISLKGMGTTLVLLVIKDGKAYICHSGDSRLYLIREKIIQITKDQTLGDYLVKHKKVPTEKVPKKAWHTLLHAVGVSDELALESQTLEMKTDDIILLCSDGLTDMLTDAEIEDIIITNKDGEFKKTSEILVDEANKKGGRDNISVVLIKYLSVEIASDKSFWKTPFEF